MYSEPCARLTRSMMPKIKVSPAASRNSSSPNCKPFRHCSMNSNMEFGAARPARPRSALRPVEGRISLVFGAEVGDEFLVGVVRQIVDPMLGAGNAEREILLQRQRNRVDGERGVERNLTLESRLRVLGEELHAGRARIEHEDGIRPSGTRFRQFGGEVE